eukprot:TRINITY_DN6075_c0_g1_i4.p1 TRINITY_DN6075_c0_g1~~TRINITY_DN6075_c0_g1_i4.p1  ORF type:complete len:115 (-),score=12.48 TRINITY_DN6075_c0_g1_i4:4-348(-)
MHLSEVLLRWPKKMPRGSIWIGKQQMVRNVEPRQIRALNKQIDLEKRNAHICLNPYLTPEQERVGNAERELTVPPRGEIMFKLRKARQEQEYFRPVRVEEGIERMKHNVVWEKC